MEKLDAEPAHGEQRGTMTWLLSAVRTLDTLAMPAFMLAALVGIGIGVATMIAGHGSAQLYISMFWQITAAGMAAELFAARRSRDEEPEGDEDE